MSTHVGTGAEGSPHLENPGAVGCPRRPTKGIRAQFTGSIATSMTELRQAQCDEVMSLGHITTVVAG